MDGTLQPAFSTYSHDAVLRSCLAAVTSAYGQLLPASRRSALLEACDNIVARVLGLTPTSGFGWFMAGQLAVERRHMAAAAAALSRPRRLPATNTGWQGCAPNLVETHYSELELNSQCLTPPTSH